MGSLSPVFVDQYGWDEALLFVVPIVIAVVVVRRLDKRSRRETSRRRKRGETRDTRRETVGGPRLHVPAARLRSLILAIPGSRSSIAQSHVSHLMSRISCLESHV